MILVLLYVHSFYGAIDGAKIEKKEEIKQIIGTKEMSKGIISVDATDYVAQT